MNKALIVVLAVCLVSVHAFVKRDAETQAQPTAGADLVNSVQEFAKTIGQKFNEAFNPEQIKKDFNEFVENAKQSIDKLSAKPDAPKQ